MAVASLAQSDADTNIEHSVEAYVADWKVALTMIMSILNGKPLLPERQAGEQRRLDATVVERRKNLSGNARSDREVRKGSLTGS
jgi:hypothetical protein